jgi:hypothetical protein
MLSMVVKGETAIPGMKASKAPGSGFLLFHGRAALALKKSECGNSKIYLSSEGIQAFRDMRLH